MLLITNLTANITRKALIMQRQALQKIFTFQNKLFDEHF